MDTILTSKFENVQCHSNTVVQKFICARCIKNFKRFCNLHFYVFGSDKINQKVCV